MKTSEASKASKFIGRRASNCRKCQSPLHYVNPIGGISCLSCYPPRKPEHVTMRLICEAGVWTTEDDAFFVPSADGVTSPPQAAPTTTAAEKSADNLSSRVPKMQVVRRKSTDDYTDAEIGWFFCSGGMLDQFDEAAAVLASRPLLYRPPVCRPGETIRERDERLQRFRLGRRGFVATRKTRSDHGAVPAVLTEPLDFVESSAVVDGRVRHQLRTFHAGEACLLFPGRKVPPQDPQAGSMAECLRAKGNFAGRYAIVRLDGLLRCVSEKSVRILT